MRHIFILKYSSSNKVLLTINKKLRQHKLSWPLPHLNYIELISSFPIIQPTPYDQSILALVGLFFP